MSDSGSKKPGVPAWQLKATENPTPESESDATSEAAEEPTRETVIEQAKKFLEDDEVRDASTDKKIAFLESKGLRSNEIQELLGVTRNPDATSSSSAPEPAQEPVAPPAMPSQATSQAPSQSLRQQIRDTPPIITYPEFLTTSPAPPPLITKKRLLTTLYLFSGLSALLYGTNNYLVQPMIKSLTTSRLDLSSTALSNLQKLISKLEGVVSEIPPSVILGQGYKDDDEDSDEDPSELFHRDIGVQTSESLHSSSRPETPAPNHISMQAEQLGLISSGLNRLKEDSKEEAQDNAELSSTISIFKEYLEGIAYVTPTYSYGVGGYNSDPTDDEIGRVKAQIRSVKGVLLSARSFPGGASARGIRNV